MSALIKLQDAENKRLVKYAEQVGYRTVLLRQLLKPDNKTIVKTTAKTAAKTTRTSKTVEKKCDQGATRKNTAKTPDNKVSR
jgi:hypothetical protein